MAKAWTQEELNQRISEIDQQLASMPKAQGENRNLQPLKWKLYCEKRRLNTRLAKLKGTHSFKDGVSLMQSNGYRCEECGSTEDPTLDHILPVSKGGSDALSNKRVLCNRCNAKKGNKYGK